MSLQSPEIPRVPAYKDKSTVGLQMQTSKALQFHAGIHYDQQSCDAPYNA